MFLTCSIRRKLFVQFTLVFVMLLAMAIAAIIGLVSYRGVLADLEYSINDAPRLAELTSEINDLCVPLVEQPQDMSSFDPQIFAYSQHQKFSEQFCISKDKIQDYHKRVDDLPHNSYKKVDRDRLRNHIINTVILIEEHEHQLINPAQRAQTARQLLGWLISLRQLADQMPDPFKVYVPRMAEAQKNLQFCLNIVIGTSIASFVMFLIVIGTSYHGIFEPIQKLHKAARRVADGDFQYRAELNTSDEMHELAEVFNQVSAQFHEINQDLDRKVNEKTKALIRSERLAGVGFLASGVAHEINNPLHVISTISESLEMQAFTVLENCAEEDRELFTKYLGMIQTEAFRCQEITEKLLSFARGSDIARTSTDLTYLVNDVVSMVSHLSKFQDRAINIVTEDPIYAEVNPSEIKQVVLNIVSNALEATDSGGRLEIELMCMSDQITIIFRDNGTGMTPEVQEKLFDPFFTQRKGGGGTGLGLSISHRIIEEHYGSIEVSSDGPGTGTTFRLCIPKVAKESPGEDSLHIAA